MGNICPLKIACPFDNMSNSKVKEFVFYTDNRMVDTCNYQIKESLIIVNSFNQAILTQ
jgi:hypothetical protein